MNAPPLARKPAFHPPAAERFSLDIYHISDRTRFQRQLDGSAGVVVVDRRGTICYVSPTARDIFQDDAAPVVGQNMLQFVHQKDLYYVVRGLDKLFSKRSDETSWLFRLAHLFGRWQWFNAVATTFSYSDEQITAIFLHPLDRPEAAASA